MRTRMRLTAVAAFALIAATSGAACSSSSQAGAGPSYVQVRLSDFTIASSTAVFERNRPYQLSINNRGGVSHEFVVMAPTGDHEGHEAALVSLRASDLPPEAVRTVTITFRTAAQPGELEFACHIPGHYEAGMRLPITVR